MSSAEDRYRTLLEASSTMADQPTVKAILHSLRGLLSSSSKLHGTELYLLDDEEGSLRVLEFDREVDAPAIKAGTKVSRIGAVAQVIDGQEPVFVPDIAKEMLMHPELAPFAAGVGGRSAYLFPVSTSRKRYGFLAVTKLQGEKFVPEDVEMLRSLASHVAVSLECALARDSAEQYQRELAGERDRLRLLLDINNLVVSKLDIRELFREVSRSIHAYFGSDFAALWMLKEETGQIQSVMDDFPGREGLLAEVPAADLTASDLDKLRTRKAEVWSAEEFDKLPANRRDPLKAESILSLAIAGLATGDKPLGALVMGSRKTDAFGQRDLDLFSQIGNQISLALDNALAYGRLYASATRLEEERLYLESEIEAEYNFEDIVGKSTAMQEVMKQIAIVAPTDSTVLLHGETGTGKELFARALHTGSPRRERTFVKLNCAAIPSGLLESELFGHEKGAFTGALMQKKGRFEIADHGTLFLDEIGDISMELQPKLLRAVQEREFERLGSTKTIGVDVRLIAATHRDIPTMIRESRFREDLFYRLNVFPIEIPPLRERAGDIPLLVHYFVSRLARRMHKNIKTIPKQAMEALTRSSWPGNVRELENLIERAVILTQGSELNVPIAELKYASRASGTTASVSTFQDAERQAIIDALKAASGKLAGEGGAAGRLGLKRTTLQNKMRRLNISRADYAQ
jgi:formate hydrogenlyase transcriptional activator